MIQVKYNKPTKEFTILDNDKEVITTKNENRILREARKILQRIKIYGE